MSRKDVTDEMVVRVVAAYGLKRKWHHDEHVEYPYEVLARLTGEHGNVCYRAVERAAEHGLIDYGVSLRTGWLTEKGIALLEEV